MIAAKCVLRHHAPIATQPSLFKPVAAEITGGAGFGADDSVAPMVFILGGGVWATGVTGTTGGVGGGGEKMEAGVEAWAGAALDSLPPSESVEYFGGVEEHPARAANRLSVNM